ncbi:MAG TPA: SpoIIE family protein phosphatase [Bacteroidales bacterium]|nr:SpoIIE family protein phosphatase [Bacteroidales bacterium]
MGVLQLTYYPGILTHYAGFEHTLPCWVLGFPYSPAVYTISAIVIIAVVLWLIMLQTRNLVKTRKLLKEQEQDIYLIANQKYALEQKDKDMTDSLVYAQRIQEALLPSEVYFRKHFRDAFIFYRPKDIVSGDFYWIGSKGEKVFVVAADCTGHGVPGALMSMIGLNIIEKTINEENIEIPSRILGILNKSLEQTFSREKNLGTIIRDGMDVSLCVIDKKKRKLEYAGAFLPLYHIRNNSLHEIKPDKLIIGMNPDGLEYHNHEIDIMEDDIFYLFSDGYADQFGGSENKKFMYRRFRYLLLTIHQFPVEDQKAILEENFRTWIGRNEQVDDIMVIGFKPLG